MKEFEEISQTIEKEIPELSHEITLKKSERKKLFVFQYIVLFAAYTEKVILSGNLEKIKKCFTLAEQLYQKGNEMIKVAFEHFYIPRLHLEMNDTVHTTARALLPFCLFRSYVLLYNHQKIEK